MAGRSGRRRVDPSSPLVDLDAVFADDALIDAISAQSFASQPTPFAGGPSRGSNAGPSGGVLLTVDPLTEILESWRNELAVAPLPAPPPALRTAMAVQQTRPPSRSRSLRPALAIAAAIAALLVGSASIGSKDAPRDSPLFALTEVLWPSRAASVASADHVGAILVEVRSALDDGRPQDAQLALLRATVELGRVDEVDGKGDMQQRVAAMWVEAAPQEPTSTRAQDTDGPTPAGTRSSASQVSPSPAAGAPQAAASQAAAAPQIDSPPSAAAAASLTSILQAALGGGWPTAAAVAPAPSNGGVTSTVDTPAASAAEISSAVAPTVPSETASAAASAPSTPPQPTAPVDPPAEQPVADPPSATEQSPPAPTPSGPASSVDTVAPDGSGPLPVIAGAGSSNAATDSQVASIPLDPAAVGSG